MCVAGWATERNARGWVVSPIPPHPGGAFKGHSAMSVFGQDNLIAAVSPHYFLFFVRCYACPAAAFTALRARTQFCPSLPRSIGGPWFPAPKGRTMSTVSTQRPCFQPIDGRTPAISNPALRCNSIDGALPEPPITATISRNPMAVHRRTSSSSNRRPTPRLRAIGETYTESSQEKR